MATALRLAVYLLLIAGGRGINVKVTQDVVEASLRGDIRLGCNYQTTHDERKNLFITWSKIIPDKEEDVTVILFQGKPYVMKDYEGRVEFVGGWNEGVADILLHNLNNEDNGDYTCAVTNVPDIEGHDTDTVQLIVLVPPSLPKISTSGAPELGGDIVLTCKSDEGAPKPQYFWKRLEEPDKEVAMPPKVVSDADAGTLTMKNLSLQSHNGIYQCTSKNKMGELSSDYQLTVSYPKSNALLYMGAMAGGVLLLILIIVVVVCCVRRRNRKNIDDNYSMTEEYRRDDKSPIPPGHQDFDPRDGNDEDRNLNYVDKDEHYDERSDHRYTDGYDRHRDNGDRNNDRRRDDFDRRRDDYDRRRDDNYHDDDRRRENYGRDDSSGDDRRREDYGRGREDYGRGREDYGRGREDYDRGREDYGRGRDNYGRGRDNYGRGREDYDRGREDYDSRDESYSNDDHPRRTRSQESLVDDQDKYSETNPRRTHSRENLDENAPSNRSNNVPKPPLKPKKILDDDVRDVEV
uniref:cell surface A33 antigen-like n=1 Tax=Myxine glutinosa TaxID=7769 RepID=UPI00358E24BF